MDYGSLSFSEMKSGYRFDEHQGGYVCNFCQKVFKEGEVFPFGESFYFPEKAVIQHIISEHGGVFENLIHSETKYNTLTNNQKELFLLFHAGVSDKEIAKKLGITASTVRRQKFTFREKAKQAKLYLAIYENVIWEKETDKDAMIPIHDNAIGCDDRYIITKEENQHILETVFTSLSPLKLKTFPAKEKKKVATLIKIAECFEKGKEYTEKEINEILKSIYDDFSVIRRYLIIYGFMDRTKDGAKYWLK